MSDSSKHTGQEVASVASKVLRDGRTSEDSKAVGASALSQADLAVDKQTSDEVAAKAAEVLQSDETGQASKTTAASALSQIQS